MSHKHLLLLLLLQLVKHPSSFQCALGAVFELLTEAQLLRWEWVRDRMDIAIRK